MKKLFLLALMSTLTLSMLADNAADAKKILDKAAAVVGKKSGAQANFQISNAKLGNTTGTIAIKGNKFNARTAQATVWFNGKTQWTYMKQTDEVNIITPTQAQQTQMNPLTFINMYKQGYKLSLKSVEGKHEVRMQATDKKRSVQEMYIVIDKKTFVPTQVRMRQKESWTTINITNFKSTAQSDAIFTFNKTDFPSAEIIDLR